MTSISRRSLLAGTVAALGLGACGVSDDERPGLLDEAQTQDDPKLLAGDGEPLEAVGPPTFTRTAQANPSELVVFEEPAGEVSHRFDNPDPNNRPLVFLVDEFAQSEVDDIWHRVLLPVRPNGSMGWVRNADVSIMTNPYRIFVDLENFRVRVREEGVKIADFLAGVAAENSPTPGGRYYITELVKSDPDTIYGPFAYGLSGFSETFETFRGGPGQLGIHGTNDPGSLGTPVSAGCIRLHNDDVTLLTAYLPLGTPVEVF